MSKAFEGFSCVLSTDVDIYVQNAWMSVCLSRAVDIIAAKLRTVRGGQLKRFKKRCFRDDGVLSFPCEKLDGRVTGTGKLTYYTVMLLRQEYQLLSDSLLLWRVKRSVVEFIVSKALSLNFYKFRLPSLVPLKVDSIRAKS